MDIGKLIDILSILTNLVGLAICLFFYFEHAIKPVACAVCFLAGSLLSNYYWGVYELIMGSEPDVTSVFAHLGWNIAFPALTVMVYHLWRTYKKKWFRLTSLLPVPLNAIQLAIYIQYGGVFNNIWQVAWTTCAACYALDIMCMPRREKDTPPRAAQAALLFITAEYGAWTASCFTLPGGDSLYNILNILCGAGYLFIPLSLAKELGTGKGARMVSWTAKAFRPAYACVVGLCCIGGVIAAAWMRNRLMPAGEQDGSYEVIAAMLFMVSLVIALFTVASVFVADSVHKAAEKERLEAEKTKAEQSDAAKSEFLAGMSHEIRTPMNAVLGMNEMILRDSSQAIKNPPLTTAGTSALFSEINEYAQTVDNASRMLLAIINDILDFSKIEAGEMKLTEGTYSPSAVLRDISTMFTPKAQAKGLKLTISEKELPPDLFGDEVRIRQIITNLLNNAIKYTEKGEVTLSVATTPVHDIPESVMFEIVVTDTGIGIKKEEIGNLFRKFERADTARNNTIEGTGLGLAITKSLAEMMGGTIEVESQYGEGSTFTARILQKILPDAGTERVKPQVQKNQPQNTELFHAENARILVADDTNMNLLVAKGLLKPTLITIDTAADGEEAIHLAKENSYDLILMDQQMPGMDGEEAMHHIKEDPGSPNAATPIICMTADAVAGAEDVYIAAGFDGYISKPVKGQDLQVKVMEHLPAEKIVFIKEQIV